MTHNEDPTRKLTPTEAPHQFLLPGLGEELLRASDRQVEEQRSAAQQPNAFQKLLAILRAK